MPESRYDPFRDPAPGFDPSAGFDEPPGFDQPPDLDAGPSSVAAQELRTASGVAPLPAPLRPQTWTGWLLGRIPALVTVGIIITVLLMFFEDRFIYFPAPYDAELYRSNRFPGKEIEDAWFTTSDGFKLHGWFLAHPEPRAVVLFCHGNGGNVAHWSDALRHFRDRYRVSILLFDYRGYGQSAGAPFEAGLILDAAAGRKWVAERCGVAEPDVVLVGRSLGGAVAVELAARDGAKGLILESTFTTIADVGAIHYPFLPVRTLMSTRFASIERLPKYHGPLLIAHGDADPVVPFELGQQLFAVANEPKTFVRMQGIGHAFLEVPSLDEATDRFFAELNGK